MNTFIKTLIQDRALLLGGQHGSSSPEDNEQGMPHVGHAKKSGIDQYTEALFLSAKKVFIVQDNPRSDHHTMNPPSLNKHPDLLKQDIDQQGYRRRESYQPRREERFHHERIVKKSLPDPPPRFGSMSDEIFPPVSSLPSSSSSKHHRRRPTGAKKAKGKKTINRGICAESRERWNGCNDSICMPKYPRRDS